MINKGAHNCGCLYYMWRYGMEYFAVIYKILKAIEYSMDFDEFDQNSISPEMLGVSRQRWEAIIAELVRNKYITGVELIPIAGRGNPGVKVIRPLLTIQGAEYLSENSMMKKMYKIAKGIKDVAP